MSIEEHLLRTRIHEGIFISLRIRLTANRLRMIGFLSENGNLQPCARAMGAGIKIVNIRKRRAMKKPGVDSIRELCQFMRILKSVAGAIRQPTFTHQPSEVDA